MSTFWIRCCFWTCSARKTYCPMYAGLIHKIQTAKQKANQRCPLSPFESYQKIASLYGRHWTDRSSGSCWLNKGRITGREAVVETLNMSTCRYPMPNLSSRKRKTVFSVSDRYPQRRRKRTKINFQLMTQHI